MTPSILITQCLQNDFVKPLGRYDPLPNLLHIGFDEARRLMGENPREGPVALTMKWAYRQPREGLEIVHIRDWHDPDDSFQREHLEKFGDHCLVNSDGADFAFPVSDQERPALVVNSLGLNDFIGTGLEQYLQRFAGQKVKVGLMGVWTEAKVSFLAYELRTRFPDMELAVCSALTASSSRSIHFMSLQQLERLLGMKVFSSTSDFTSFLAGESLDIPLPESKHKDIPGISITGIAEVNETDLRLIRYLFRNCKQVQLRELSGGFSGNLVLSCESVDLRGMHQVPHVLKIGPSGPIAEERESFEQVEEILGNNAPRIVEFAEAAGRGALKYRYAAIGGSFSSTFQNLYKEDLSLAKVRDHLETVFVEQLGRLYKSATSEKCNLLEHYGVTPKFSEPLRKYVEKVLETEAPGEMLKLPTGQELPNPYHFYNNGLPELFDRAEGSSFFSFVHGDLNGANIIVDDHDNVWIIDFFHTGRGHVLKDLIKLENDILYIYTPVNSARELADALELTDVLLEVEDLGKQLPPVEETGLSNPMMRRSYETIRILRSFYPPLVQEDRNALQLFIGQLRYAGHTLIFDESNHWQKLWALYTAGWCCHHIERRLRACGPLRVDSVDRKYSGKGKLGMSLLPGRKDYGRSMYEDILAMKEQGITHVLTLVTHNEFADYGVDDLLEAYREAGLDAMHFPILNQCACPRETMDVMVKWLDRSLDQGAGIMVHCVGGLGRAGLVVASYLVSKGLSPEDAMAEVRRARSPRALESEAQEDFVRKFGQDR